MHPLAKFIIPIGVALLVVAFLWWVLSPIIHYLLPFWPFLAIALAIGLLLWRLPLAQAQTILKRIGQIFTTQPIRGLLTAVFLTAVYGGFLWLGYTLGAKQLVTQLGIDQRSAWLLITVLGLPVIPVLWRLYAATGISGDPKAIGRGFRTLALLTLIFFGWWYHNQPNLFFDHQTGESKFWVAEKEKKIYFSSGFSPETGEKLREGKPEDVDRFRQDSWLRSSWRKIERKIEEFRKPSPTRRVRVEKIITISLHPDRWSEERVVPGAWKKFEFEGPPEVLVRFDDGTTGPITKRYDNRKPDEGFRFKGPEGKIVTVRISPRR